MGRKKTNPRQKTDQVVIRMNPELKEHLQEAAQSEGMNLSQWLTWVAARKSKWGSRGGTTAGVFAGSLLFASDTWAQTWTAGSVDPERLLWAAVTGAFLALSIQAAVTAKAWALVYVVPFILSLLAQLGVIDLHPAFGVIALVLGAALASRGSVWRLPDRVDPVDSWLTAVATGGAGLVGLFLLLRWLSTY